MIRQASHIEQTMETIVHAKAYKKPVQSWPRISFQARTIELRPRLLLLMMMRQGSTTVTSTARRRMLRQMRNLGLAICP
jgi:hypothetical protein